MSFDEIDVSGFEPSDKNLIREFLALPSKRRMALVEKFDQIVFGHTGTSMKMKELEPSFFWSRSWIEGVRAIFFQSPVGHYGRDGRVLEFKDTNMMMGGTIGYPLHFERSEVRVYSGAKNVQEWVKVVQGAILREYIYIGDQKKEWTIEGSLDHIPLPEPATYDKEKEPDRVDLRARANDLLEEVNGNRLPCFRVEAKRKIDPVELITFFLDSVPGHLLPPGLESIMVIIGKLWVPG